MSDDIKLLGSQYWQNIKIVASTIDVDPLVLARKFIEASFASLNNPGDYENDIEKIMDIMLQEFERDKAECQG